MGMMSSCSQCLGSHEDLVEKWGCFKVISTIHDSEVVSIIYEIKAVFE